MLKPQVCRTTARKGNAFLNGRSVLWRFIQNTYIHHPHNRYPSSCFLYTTFGHFATFPTRIFDSIIFLNYFRPGIAASLRPSEIYLLKPHFLFLLSNNKTSLCTLPLIGPPNCPARCYMLKSNASCIPQPSTSKKKKTENSKYFIAKNAFNAIEQETISRFGFFFFVKNGIADFSHMQTTHVINKLV